ncbi:MAG: protein NO VEIN domain-containing protein [Bryobacteraceae bacterium]
MSEDSKYAEAVSRLKQARIEAKEAGQLTKMERREKEVLNEFQLVFSPERIGNLSGEEFREFLKPTRNKHWSSLSRSAHRAADEGKMPNLREALKILLNEEEEPSVAKRLDKVRAMLKNVAEAVLTPILQVAYPDRYGVWNKRSGAGLKQLGLWPEFKRGTTFGEKYERINSLLLKLRDSVGEVDLWTLDVLWFSIKDSVAEAAVAAAEIEQDNDEGYQSDLRIRKAIEKHAMKVAQDHYEKEQYKVDPEKHKNEPYDMECKKDESTLHESTLHVEVKGTQGSGERIILTRREVEHASKHRMELCVVSGIKVEKGEASGGEPTFYPEWNPKDKYKDKMECIAYRCTLHKRP